jgi:hypothetical protein
LLAQNLKLLKALPNLVPAGIFLPTEAFSNAHLYLIS